ncbi:sigma-E processing peptidase SpoIIGA [Sporosarcina oncorhynchi]|uniref:Sigma-E processing peptidase SpoIIGA n=1 Tax=Sporosarcina oncorhynchi TaxID=3056444 RepID=A0ABZ0L2Q9_9BACL|nr:sigma-E processing peptidase SpoIIGA [Sporosarcina sp. T2O-4]WOV86188.1 sigma-E processing peptidase SpoIIGA [Sporosarcina sp. T2O-4]
MYGELIIGINMVFNFAVLLFANRMGKAQATWTRLALAAFIGALPVTFFPDSLIALIAAFACMILYAFGFSFKNWGGASILVLIGSLFAGGILTVLTERLLFSNTIYTVLVCALLAYITLYLLKVKWLDVRVARHLSSYNMDSQLSIWNKQVDITVFVDTGNQCSEPLSSDPVHFVSLQSIRNIVPDELLSPLESWDPKGMPKIASFPQRYQKGIRLIRLQTIQGISWAAGFKYEKWLIGEGSELPSGYIVLTKEDNRYPEGAGAILHVSALESITNERGTGYVV